MKKIILIVFTAIAPAGFLFSQIKGIGINTENPDTNTILHIDAKGNNNANPDYSDDVIISAAEGFVGVGKTTVSLKDPQSVKLDIKGGTLSLDDGTPNDYTGYLLASKDALGTTKWIARPTAKVVDGKINDNSDVFTHGGLMTSAESITTTPLTLGAGKWLVFAKFAIESGATDARNVWVVLRNETTGEIKGVVGSTIEQSGGRVGTPQLTAIVDVPKGATHNYSICGYSSNPNVKTTTKYQGSVFYAVRLDEDTL
jgi:hypothetical protein